MDSASEDEDEHVRPNDHLSPSQKSLHTAVFKAWTTRQIKSKTFFKPRADINHDVLSVSQIMGQQNLTAIVDDPREYQIELFERAKRENTIAVLDTGTGKTLIAVLLLRHIIEQELEDRQQGEAHRVAFFLVPSVNLVFQQHAVLQTNLDHPTTYIYGGMFPDIWTRERWIATFKDHKAIVCTADILRNCLEHGFITMQQINLLIFDEAHHAKPGGNAYSAIMGQHYKILSIQERPRVFGMTASPVDIKADGMDILAAAEELETNLHSKIATVSLGGQILSIAHRPNDRPLIYSPTPPHALSRLSLDILQRFGRFNFVTKMVEQAKTTSDHLGPWCGDLYWRLALKDKIESKSDSSLERFVGKHMKVIDSAKRDNDVTNFKELLSFVTNHQLRHPTLDLSDASPKLIALAGCLSQFFAKPTAGRCIVFVKERLTTAILAAYFREAGNLSINTGVLIGARSSDLGITSTIRRQVLTVAEFRQGKINCLFATSVAEEGLDIPTCNVVIRFDPCERMIQYIQSRGRARQKDSHFVHMVERGNFTHMRLLQDCQDSESLMRRFCASVPQDRHVSMFSDTLEDAAEAGDEVCQTKTGALLTLSNSMRILASFTSALPVEEDEPSTPFFTVTSTPTGFISDVILPSCSKVPRMHGQIKRRKQWARFSAAFQVCKVLLQRGDLNEHLMSTIRNDRPVMRQAALAVNLRSSSAYAMRNKPDWKQSQVPASPLHAIFITFDGLDRPFRPVILISRRKFTEIPSFPVYLSSGKASQVYAHGLAQPLLDLNPEALQLLTRFTLRILKDLFNKEYENEPLKMPYWIASSASPPDGMEASIDWQAMASCCEDRDFRWNSEMDANFLVDKFMIDPHDGGKRYFTRATAPHLKPNDRSPLNESSNERTILQQTVSLWKKSKDRFQADYSQPVLEADRVLHRRNFLARCSGDEAQQSSLCFICPQSLLISRLPTDLVATAYVLPAIIHRIESHLIAQEACDLLGLDLSPALALEALTKDSDTPDDGEDTELPAAKFHHGMGSNYERLEFLGDTFLKMATTIAVYVRNAKDTEHEFHVKRMVQLCNVNLYKHAEERKLYEYIRSKPFSRRTWYPSGITMTAGKGFKRPAANDTTHNLGQKTIADVCEAFIGAAYLTHNRQDEWQPSDWTEAVKAVTILVNNEQHDMVTWSDYRETYVIPRWQTHRVRAAEVHMAERVRHEDGYTFKNPRLLHAAFNHPSNALMQEGVPSYQQLEFLGDALLDMVCVSHLIYKYPDKDPSWLTEHKMAMVTNTFLGALCVKLGFHRHLRYTTPSLRPQIEEYCEALKAAEGAANGVPSYRMSVKDPPKALADIVEAYLGAMFLDSDFDYSQIMRFFREHMMAFFGDMSIYDTFATDHPVIRLEKRMNDFGCRSHRIMVEEIPSDGTRGDEVLTGLIIHRTVIAGDHSRSSRYGKARCASKALKELEDVSVAQFRSRYGCDCKLG